MLALLSARSLLKARWHVSLGLLCLLIVLGEVRAIEAQVKSPQGEEANPHFDIGPYSIHMPEKYFLLIRKGRSIGAVHLTQIDLDANGDGKSTYESYFQGDGSESFKGANVIKRSGEITSKPVRSITHTLSWKPGQHKLWVGNWWFGCMSPSLIPMSSHYSKQDEGFEFAPTSAQNVGEIDASDKRLRWFRFDPKGRTTVVVSDLPK